MRGLFWEKIINEVWKNGRLVILCLLMLFGIKTTSAQVVDGYDGPLPDPSIEVLADSSNFVTASLLIVTPSNSFYSVFGHAALRMQCPAYHLDYVFTFESDPNVSGFMTFFMGKSKASFVSVPSGVFLDGIEKSNRGLTQYELNLSHRQKQNLWRLLDEDVAKGECWRFSLRNNCVSMLERDLEIAIEGDSIMWNRQMEGAFRNNGDELRHDLRQSPWAEFVFVSFGGAACGDQFDFVARLCPENLPNALREASFVNMATSEQRPVLKSDGQHLLPTKKICEASAFSPTIVFSLLLLICVIVTLLEWLLGWKRPARWFDRVLFVAQTLAGTLLLLVTLGSDVFHMQWNWYLVPLNPLPFLLWVGLHKRKSFGNIYLFYVMILAAFLALTPFVAQLDLPHQLITATLAIRCMSNYLDYRKKIINNKNK